MQHLEQLQAIRNLVRNTMRAEGVESLEGFFEQILLRGGYYCGRSFSCNGYRAVWFVEEQTIKFYHSDGRVLYSMSLDSMDVEEQGLAEQSLVEQGRAA